MKQLAVKLREGEVSAEWLSLLGNPQGGGRVGCRQGDVCLEHGLVNTLSVTPPFGSRRCRHLVHRLKVTCGQIVELDGPSKT